MRTTVLFSAVLVGAALSTSSVPVAGGTLSPHLLVRSPLGQKSGSHDVEVSVRLTQAPTKALLQKLAAAGATPRLLEKGRLAAVGTVVAMRVPRHQLAALAALPEVQRIDPAVPPFLLRPLNETAPLIGAPSVWSTPSDGQTWGVLGEGVLVADHESGFDPFHPDFFRPDGGLYDFEDTNGDHKAGPGDKVDLDGDGVFEATLVLLEGYETDIYMDVYDKAEPGYQPDVDWLFVDVNGDHQRNFGAADGFSDQDPALGEPIFVGDDVNGDGVIAGGERLVRLGTPKVRVGYREGSVFRRGQNLSGYPVMDASHGTGATGIVAMGWPELRRYTGIAPAADLALVASEDIVAGIAFAQAEGANVNLYEFNLPAEASDGSSNVEAAISQAAASGSVQVAAAGNLAGVDKVMRLALTPNTPVSVDITTDSWGYYSYDAALAQLTWRGNAEDVEVAVIGPQGTRLELGPNTSEVVDGFLVQAFSQNTDHGNGWVMLYLTGSNGGVLPESKLTVELSSAIVPVVQGLLFDTASGWGRGVSWMSNVSDNGTALCPATADNVIAVAAYGGKHDFSMYAWGAVGERRTYSGMGPRVDGAAVVDIAAPDDPFTAAPHNESSHGAYQAFGGTSGALPHVAGAAALLMSANPSFKHSDVEAVIKSSARLDSITGNEPSEEYGHGKLHIDAALLGSLTEPGTPPSITLALVGPAVVGEEVTLRAAIDDPDGHGSDVLVAWDVGYDRDYEIPASDQREITVPFDHDGLRIVAKAVDPTGRSSRTLLWLTESQQDAGADVDVIPDAATESDAGGEPDADASVDPQDADAETPASSKPSAEDDDGCGCSVVGSGSRGGGSAIASLIFLALLGGWRPRAWARFYRF